MVEPQPVRLCWTGRAAQPWSPKPRCPEPRHAEVVDSFLLAEGRVAGLDRHESRFRSGCAARGLDVPEERIRRFLGDVRARLPRTGRWFPRLEAHRGSPAPLVLWLRPAPDPQPHITLWDMGGPDPRRHPRCKGPDLAQLSDLRQRARAAGADDVVLHGPDGVVRETGHAGLLWWRGDRLYYPDPELPRLPSVTSALLRDCARRLGVEPDPERARLADLTGAEVWAVNTLHGIRPVAGWVGDGHPPRTVEPDRMDRERLTRYRAGLVAATEPVRAGPPDTEHPAERANDGEP